MLLRPLGVENVTVKDYKRGAAVHRKTFLPNGNVGSENSINKREKVAVQNVFPLHIHLKSLCITLQYCI